MHVCKQERVGDPRPQKIYSSLLLISGKPEVEWFANGKPVSDSEDFRYESGGEVYKLIIGEIFPEDGGVYTCRASNTAGSSSSSATVFVSGPVVSEFRQCLLTPVVSEFRQCLLTPCRVRIQAVSLNPCSVRIQAVSLNPCRVRIQAVSLNPCSVRIQAVSLNPMSCQNSDSVS